MASSLGLGFPGFNCRGSHQRKKKKRDLVSLFVQDYLMTLDLCYHQSGALKGKCHERERAGGRSS